MTMLLLLHVMIILETLLNSILIRMTSNFLRPAPIKREPPLMFTPPQIRTTIRPNI